MNCFVKSHGLGNDYIVLNSAEIDFDLGKAAIELICHRNYGVGSDGILLLVPSARGDFGLRILNPDGSEAEKSGNGLRIFAKYLYERKYASRRTFSIDTPGGLVTAEVEEKDGKVHHVTVDMGRATFRSDEIPVDIEEEEAVGQSLALNVGELDFTAVSVGNPHCVIFFDDIEEDLIRKLGPQIENHPVFPNRTNVQFAQVVSRDRVRIVIWERGAGYTLASGSSSCAVAAVCVKMGLTDRRVRVEMPGGHLDINVAEDWSITMRGEVEEVFSGTLSEDLLYSLRSLSTVNS
ncbi:MAG: diaminopimelate epimerase [Candidatus Dadabacteria bacterium]|nr:diaminopimelate epimerase [Candidatus Dadabacteria bacterium]